MRALSLILATCIMFLMVAPFAKADKKADCCKTTCMKGEDKNSGKENRGGQEICNPFFCHSCCAKFTSVFTLPFEFEMELGTMDVPSSVKIHSLYNADFWQPPKLL